MPNRRNVRNSMFGVQISSHEDIMKASAIPRTLEVKVVRATRRLSKPRRRAPEEAIDEYVARHDREAVTRAMNRVADAIDTRLDPALAGAARHILERTEW